MIATRQFGDLPNLPNLAVKVKKSTWRQVKFEDVFNMIKLLCNQNLFSLACDLLVCLTMGLRKHDLMRVYFVNNSGCDPLCINIL